MIFNYFDNFVFICSRKEKCLFFGISLPWSTNRPLPSSKILTLGRPLKCRTFLVNRKWLLFVWEWKNHLHIKGWALNLVLIQRPDGTRILPIADINFFILVPRYWRGTKVHGPCDRGPWLWFWTVNWSMRVCNWVSHWKAALIQFPGSLPIFLSQPVIFRLFRSKTVKLQPILFFYTRGFTSSTACSRCIVLAISQGYIGWSHYSRHLRSITLHLYVNPWKMHLFAKGEVFLVSFILHNQ